MITCVVEDPIDPTEIAAYHGYSLPAAHEPTFMRPLLPEDVARP